MSRSKWPRYSLLFAAMFITMPLMAQDADDDAEGAGDLEEVIITGSRIRQNPLDVRTPVQFHTEEDMDLTSSLSAADYLQRLPITGSSINRLITLPATWASRLMVRVLVLVRQRLICVTSAPNVPWCW